MIYTTFTLLEIAKGHLMYFTPKNIESILQFIKYEQIYSQYSSIYHKRAFQGFQENLFLYFSRFFKVFLESYLFSMFSRSLFGIQGFSSFSRFFKVVATLYVVKHMVLFSTAQPPEQCM